MAVGGRREGGGEERTRLQIVEGSGNHSREGGAPDVVPHWPMGWWGLVLSEEVCGSPAQEEGARVEEDGGEGG